jgi:hydroxymethylpyrimidine pyrophosphatase-like HAD family hydrolase
LSFIMAERRQGLEAHADASAADSNTSAGILSSIKRFFGL